MPLAFSEWGSNRPLHHGLHVLHVGHRGIASSKSPRSQHQQHTGRSQQHGHQHLRLQTSHTKTTFSPQSVEGQGEHWVRAAVGVSFRWVSLLPPSLLQPRVSPMGCNGIRYSMNMQPKKRNGVLLGRESLHPELVQTCKCREGKKTTKKLKKNIFSTAGGANCLFNYYISASGKKQKSPSMCCLAEVEKLSSRMKEQVREE